MTLRLDLHENKAWFLHTVAESTAAAIARTLEVLFRESGCGANVPCINSEISLSSCIQILIR